MENRSKVPQERILIVDDDPMIRKMLSDILSSQGYQTETSESSSNAMEKLMDGKYSLLFLDVRIPGISGLELLKYCKHSQPDVEIIIITGQPELEDAVSTVKSGAFDYLSKPVPVEKLLQRTADALELRRKKMMKFSYAALSESGNHFLPPDPLPLPGYNVVRSLGNGAMSSVYLVERAGKQYALKILRYGSPDGFNDETRLARFLREADILSGISHPNIVRIYHAGFTEGGKVPFILMEHIKGRSLTELIKLKHMHLEEKLLLLRQIARALKEVHAHNILHRDIKPGNILVTEQNKAKLVDFGIARLEDSSLTLTHEVLGSPAYMPPEAFDPDAQLTPASDIFSFGVVAYEFITGVKPFRGDTAQHMMSAIKKTLPPAPKSIVKDLPDPVQDFLAALLVKNPARRPRNMEAVLEDLDSLLETGRLRTEARGRLFGDFLRLKKNWSK